MRCFLFLSILAIYLASCSHAIPLNGRVDGRGERLGESEKELMLLENANGFQNSDIREILSEILDYLSIPDYIGLLEYLGTLPKLQELLDWLEIRHLDVFVKVCWLFDACKEHDLVIDPETMQRILKYIADEDWEGLAGFIKTIENHELLLEWIRTTFPAAWPNICGYFDKCTLLSDILNQFIRE